MVAISDFFYVFIPDDAALALADAPHDPELGKRVRAGGQITDWKVLNFELGPGLVSDYLANSFAFRLCSQRLREVIEQGKGPADSIQWLPAVVKEGNGQTLNYWVLHFPDVPNVINVSQTKMAGPVIIKAVLDARLVARYRVFSFPNQSHSLVVSQHVRDLIQQAKCTGVEFSRVPMA